MKAVDNKGVEHDFVLDIDTIIAMETENPDYSFIEDMSSMGKKMKLASLDRVCKAMGTGLKEMLSLGFTIDKIIDIAKNAIEEAGFFSAPQEAE